MSDSAQQQVVDLTDDVTAQPAAIEKKRTLPSSVLPPGHPQTQLRASNLLPLPSISTLPSARTLPPSFTYPAGGIHSKQLCLVSSILIAAFDCSGAPYVPNVLLRQAAPSMPSAHALPYALVPPGSRPATQGAPIVANVRPATQASVPNARIVFSIVNSRQFTARAENGTVSPALVATFKMIPDAKFDWQTCKWLFPLHAHDNLQVCTPTYFVFPRHCSQSRGSW
jgi:hypothetical protein